MYICCEQPRFDLIVHLIGPHSTAKEERDRREEGERKEADRRGHVNGDRPVPKVNRQRQEGRAGQGTVARRSFPSFKYLKKSPF